MKVQPGIWEWFLQYRRDPHPRKVRVRAADLESAHAYWVRVTRAERPLDVLVAEARRPWARPHPTSCTLGKRPELTPGRLLTRRSPSRTGA